MECTFSAFSGKQYMYAHIRCIRVPVGLVRDDLRYKCTMYMSLDTAVFLPMRSAFKAMAPILLGCTALYALAPPATLAQTSGTIRYQRTVKPEISEGMMELPSELPQEIKEQLLASMSAVDTTAWLLHFTEKASVMTPVSDSTAMSDRSVRRSRGNVSVRMQRSQDRTITHTDLEDWTTTEQKDFLGRTFLIRGDRPEYAWRLTGQQSEYLGFACQQAVTEVDSAAVEAWFAPELPVWVGPAAFGGLPGAILVLSIDDGKLTTWNATHVSPGMPEEALMAPPEKGREVTQEEFAAIVKEKTEEMQSQGGNGRIVIRRIDR